MNDSELVTALTATANSVEGAAESMSNTVAPPATCDPQLVSQQGKVEARAPKCEAFIVYRRNQAFNRESSRSTGCCGCDISWVGERIEPWSTHGCRVEILESDCPIPTQG